MERSTLAFPGKLLVVRGRAATGKTERLVRRAADLLAEGCATDRLLMAAATPDAVQALEERLRAALGADAPLPRVTTLRALELEVLGLPAAQDALGRDPRVLLDFEQQMLIQDMLPCRVAPKRLSGMLRFFYRSWADLEPMEGDWFYSEEEERVYDCLLRQLAYRRSYLPEELARACAKFLKEHPGEAEQVRFEHVLVDDYQMLSRASQQVAGLLARTSLAVAGDSVAAVTALEEFPNAAGLDELAAANPDATVLRLEEGHQAQAVAAALNTLTGDETLGGMAPVPSACPDEGSFALAPCVDPDDEFRTVAELVEAWIGRGIAPGAIAVAATTGTWAHDAADALAKRHIPLRAPERLRLSGDVRDLARCVPARAVTLLSLIADPADPVAVRAWCGFGDHLANSGLFAALEAQGAHLTLDTEALDGLENASPLLRQESIRVLAALAEGRQLVAGLAGLAGPQLFESVCVAVGSSRGAMPAALCHAVARAGVRASAQAMLDAIRQAFLFPRLTGDGVAVGTIDDFAGLRFTAVAVAGLSNGLAPLRSYFDPARIERDRRPGILARIQHRLYAAAESAQQNLVFSWFTEAPLAAAEAQQMKIDRVRLSHGQRVCDISPSEAIRTLTGVYFHD